MTHRGWRTARTSGERFGRSSAGPTSNGTGHTVEVLVALTHATLAIAAILADSNNHGSQ